MKGKKIKIQEQRVHLKPREKASIYNMFFGPYLKEWKDEKGIVCNTDKYIAGRLNLDEILVSNYITKIANEHFERVIKKINKDSNDIKKK